MRLLCLLLPLAALACTNPNFREPQPEPTIQAGDKDMSCEDLAHEYKYNTGEAEYLITTNQENDRKERAPLIVLGPLGLSQVDLRNASSIEGNALLDRNGHLLSLAKNKSCETSSWPKQPNRYE